MPDNKPHIEDEVILQQTEPVSDELNDDELEDVAGGFGDTNPVPDVFKGEVP